MKIHLKRNTSILFASVIIAFSALFASCSERKDTDGRLERLTDEWAVYASNGENQKLIDSARPILYKALEEEDFNTASYAGAYISQAFSMMFRPDSMYFYIDLIKDRNGKIESGFPAMVISNTVGVYNLIYSMNYSEALYYFYDALDNCDDGRNRAMIMWNIVNTCYLREDTTGIEYAREIHDYGKATEDDYITYIGALACAYMFYQAGTLDSALVYAEETTTLDAYNGNINNSDALHGNILAALGKDREAEAYFQRAIIHSYPDYSTLIESYLSYGQFLAGKGKYDKAINYYRKGLETAIARTTLVSNMFTGELDEVEDYAYLKKNAERYCISPNGRYIACTFYDFYTDESGSEPSSDINYPALVDTETGEAILFDKAGFMKSMGTTASNDGTLFGNTTDSGDPQGYVFTKGTSSGVPVGEWMMSEYGIITDNNRYVMNISADNNTVSGWYYIGE